jgi:hypothetical protein
MMIDARLVLGVSLACISILFVLGLIAAYIAFSVGSSHVLLRVFLLNKEANLPTFFSCMLLVSCGLLLALVSAHQLFARTRYRLHWAFLTCLFLLAAFDEAASLHERLIEPVRAAFDATGWAYFAWVIPAWAFVTVLALLYVPMLRDLPKPFGRLFLLSGALYLGGALGVEMPEGAYAEVYGTETFTFHVFATVEETLEMIGLAVFAYALVRYLAHLQQDVRLSFR